MTLKDLIESKKESCGSPEENLKKYKTYRKYHKAMAAKFGKSFNDFSEKERDALDAGWKAEDE